MCGLSPSVSVTGKLSPVSHTGQGSLMAEEALGVMPVGVRSSGSRPSIGEGWVVLNRPLRSGRWRPFTPGHSGRGQEAEGLDRSRPGMEIRDGAEEPPRVGLFQWKRMASSPAAAGCQAAQEMPAS